MSDGARRPGLIDVVAWEVMERDEGGGVGISVGIGIGIVGVGVGCKLPLDSSSLLTLICLVRL